jgi:adenylate cyclase
VAQDRVERRLAAILAADVVGYGRLIRADEEGVLAALNALRKDLIEPKIAAHHGRVVKLMGDGMLAEFASVVDAVRMASEFQRSMAERNADRPEDQRIAFRVGINLGDVVIEGDDIHGDGVNVAARLEGLADPGGICISGNVYEEVRDRVDLPFEDLGEREVKNINRPVRVWRWVADASVRAAAAGQGAAVVPLPLPDKPSIAVLSFDNLSGDPEQEYFADGIAEDLITALSRIRWLFVTARNSTFTYKGRSSDVRQVGKELGVRYVLEGSVRKGGNRVRVTAQLIDATTGNHVWAERYDRELADLFDLQDEITEVIVTSVGPELDAMERDRARRKPPESLDAWESYQRGLWNLFQFTEDDNREAQRHFHRAIKLDPSFATAHAGLAFAHGLAVNSGFSKDRTESLNQLRLGAQRAVAEDEKDAFGHALLARSYTYSAEYQAAIDAVQTAIDLNPNFAYAHHVLALAMISVNKPDEAIKAADAAARLSPHDPMYAYYDAARSIACFLTRDYEQAL